jgi:hypothetical protein
MAIKGKKKQQSRGSQARRRPAAAPRPPVVVRRPPWYRTDRGRLVAGIVAIVVIGVAWWAIADVRTARAQLARQQSAVEDYTSRARAYLQAVRPAAEGMAQEPTTADAAGFDSLETQARAWIETLQSAREQTGVQVEGDALVNANGLFRESISIYTNAARTYALAIDASGSLRRRVLERAAAQRDDAGMVWLSATQVLDAERARLGLEASGIATPATPALGANPPSQPPGPTGPNGEAPEGAPKDRSEGDGSGGAGGGN